MVVPLLRWRRIWCPWESTLAPLPCIPQTPPPPSACVSRTFQPLSTFPTHGLASPALTCMCLQPHVSSSPVSTQLLTIRPPSPSSREAPPPRAQEALRASGAGPAGLPCPCVCAFSVVGLPQCFHGGTGCKLLGDATSTFSWAHPRRHPQDPFRQAWPCVVCSFIVRNTYLVFDPILGTEHPKPLEFPK